MALEPGTRLGSYEITAAIGAGGMGEVYKARDTSLRRDVAIKVLPEAVVESPDRLARFQREAEALAALNHPNIAQVYGLEKSGDTPAIVMELVEGPTLADRNRSGPIPVDGALAIARQLTEALEAAHERGIIHRDLKPANIKVTDDGTVKVLDFGLAKVVAPPGEPTEDIANSPTMTARATQMGVVLGTAAYMAPEQAKGKHVDKRVDTWAFGVVLYEMLTGRRPFGGSDVSEVMAQVIDREPDWHALPAELPAAIRRLLRRCLVKDKRNRLPDIIAARLEIDEAAAEPTVERQQFGRPPLSGRVQPITWRLALVAAAALGLAAWTGLWIGRAGTTPETHGEVRFSVPVDNVRRWAPAISVSPDGRLMAYVTRAGLTVRHMDNAMEDRVVLSPERRRSASFFSPNSQRVGVSLRSGLMTVGVNGDDARLICEISPTIGFPTGVSWADDGWIYFAARNGGIQRCPGNGGDPQLVVPAEPDEQVHDPQVLPDGNSVLYTVAPADGEARLVIGSIETGTRIKELDITGRAGRYLEETGHLIYAVDDRLYAVRFDPTRLETRGDAVVVESRVDGTPQSAFYAVSENGTLVYVEGDLEEPLKELVWRNANRLETPLDISPRLLESPRLSPDESRVAWAENGDIFVSDVERPRPINVTADTAARDSSPIWVDDDTLVFRSVRDGAARLFARAANGTGESEPVTDVEEGITPSPAAVTRDGTRVIYTRRQQNGRFLDIRVVSLRGNTGPEDLFPGEESEGGAALSPDGNWIAYASGRGGRSEVYLSPFPNVNDDIIQASSNGGTSPQWSPDGSTLFYRWQSEVLSVPISFGASPVPGAETGLFDLLAPGEPYNVASSGRFLYVRPVEEGSIVQVVLNWFDVLRERFPTR